MFGQTSAFGSPTPNTTSSPFGQQQPQQQSNTGGFGGFGGGAATSTSPFGAPSSGFGAAPASSGFGASTAGFGSATTTPFGSPTPAPSTGGLFGSSSAAAAPSTGFGSTGFGSSTTTNTGGGLFGSSTTAPAPTGGLFGAPTAAPSTGLFGAPSPAPTTGGLFGAPSPAPAFGSGFGGASGGFGATGFGAPAPAPSGGLFGSSTTTTTTSPFGASAPVAGNITSQSARYEVTSAMDGPVRINLQSITAQPTFSGMSFEEIRLADYKSGNRGGGGTPAPSGGLFGSPAPAPSGGLFGAPAAPAPSGFGFGATPAAAPNTSPFGAPKPATGFGGFGAPTPAPFGAPAPAPTGGLFGSPAPAPTGGLFGSPAPATGGLFGAPAPAPTGGLFGAPVPAPASGFGFSAAATPAPAPTGGLFGSPAPAPSGGLFGAPVAPAPAPTGGLFGALTSAPSGGLFGAPAPSGGLFGSSTPAPAPTGGLFGAPAPASGGGLFGSTAKPPTSGLFGSTAAPVSATPGGLFGSPAPAPTGGLFGSSFGAPAPSMGLFGSTTAAPAVSGGLFSPTSNMPSAVLATTLPSAPTAEQVLEQKLALIEHQRQENEKLEPWRSSNVSKETSAVGQTEIVSTSDTAAVYRATTSPSSRAAKIATPRSLAKIRPRGYTPSSTSATPGLTTATTPIGKFAHLSSPATPLTTPGIKSLAIRADIFTATPRVKNRIQYLTNGEAAERNGESINTPSQKAINGHSPAAYKQTPSLSVDRYHQAIESPVREQGAASQMITASSKDLMPILSKPHYTISPNLDNFNEADLASVDDFTVSHNKHGSITWEGAVDVRGVNIDKSVIISAKEAVVYGREEELGTKPALGTKLNRPAIITLNNVFPKEGIDPEKYKVKITKNTHKMGAKMINYDVDTGVWQFRVEHFSRYGLNDDDDSEDEEVNEPVPSEKNQIIPWGEVVKPENASDFFIPRSQLSTKHNLSSTRYSVPSFNASSFDTTDEESEEAAVDEDMVDVNEQEEKIVIAADEAFGTLTELIGEDGVPGAEEKEISLPLDYDNEEDLKRTVASSVVPRIGRPIISLASYGSSIPSLCSEIASKNRVPFNTNRMFRVGWSPNNTLVTIKDRSKLLFLKPNLKVGILSKAMFEEHLKSSKQRKSDPYKVIRSLPSIDSDYIHVCSALHGYLKASKIDRDSHGICNLINALYGQNENMHQNKNSLIPVDENRSNAKSLAMLRCRREYILHALQSLQDDASSYPILSALCINDLETAAKVAMDKGHFHLSLIISNYNGNSEDLSIQISLWKSTGHLNSINDDEVRRVYMVLGNDLSLERELCANKDSRALDWISRLGLAIVQGGDTDMKDIIANYDIEVADGTAPHPTSKYNLDSQSVLYSIIKLYATSGGRDGTITLSQALNPSGYAPSQHDYGLSWHISHLLTSLGVSSLSTHHQLHIMDSMISQLLYTKQYGWAIYVSLCALPGRDSDTEHIDHFNIMTVKKLLHHYLHLMEPIQCKWLTDEVGVPVEWLEESIAWYTGYNGDKIKHVRALGNAGMFDQCARASRMLLIPEAIINGGESVVALNELLIKLANATQGDVNNLFWADTNGCGVVLETLQLTDRVSSYLDGDLEYSDELIHEELQMVRKLKLQITDPEAIESLLSAPYLACRVSQSSIENSACIVSIMDSLSMLESKLELLGSLSFDELREIKVSDMSIAQLSALECRALGKQSSFSLTNDRIRGMVGYLCT